MNRKECFSTSVSDLRGMCKRKGVSNYSRENKDWLVTRCCLDLNDLTVREMQDICSANDIPGYSKLDKPALQDKCKTVRECNRKDSTELRKMCSDKNVSYGGMNKDDMRDWCCMDLDDTFGKMGITEIKKYLKDHGASGYSRANKSELIKWGKALELCERKYTTELRKICKSEGIKGYSGLSKEELVNTCCVPHVKESKKSRKRTAKKRSSTRKTHDLRMSEERDYDYHGGGKLYVYEGDINGKQFIAQQTFGHMPWMDIIKGEDKLTESEKEAIYNKMEGYG